MGLFDFIKSAGKALGIGGDDEAPSADALKKELDSHGLGTENLSVEVDGDKAIIRGDVADQTILEKAIIAVGNTLGISKVESEIKIADATAAVGAAIAGATTAPKDPVLHTVKKGDTFGPLPWPATARAKATNTTKYLKPTVRCSHTPTRSIRARCCAFPISADGLHIDFEKAGRCSGLFC